MRLQRTITCGELRLADEGREVILNGWVDTLRDHGGLVCVEVRDRYGSTQVMADPEQVPELKELRPEFVVAVRGTVAARPPENRNPYKPTGDIEVQAAEIEILNRSKTPPFEVVDELKTREELRLEYRYVDMRRRPVLRAIELRGRLTGLIRRVMEGQGFIEVETPILMKTSPEGARDFIVPCLRAGAEHSRRAGD
jgi:aspartyl-tRNA synthetase